MYNLKYEEKSIKIYKNVSPFLNGTPLWDMIGEYFNGDDIPQDILNILGNEVQNNIVWFFEDIS